MTEELEQERQIYLKGIHLFNEHEFFEAHEIWEDCWRMAYSTKHDFYQGLIQCAVALEHYHRSNPRGVVTLFENYNRRLAKVPPVFMGVDVTALKLKMHEVLRPVLEANPLPERGEIKLDASKAPQIELIYDPFATGEAQKFAKPEKF